MKFRNYMNKLKKEEDRPVIRKRDRPSSKQVFLGKALPQGRNYNVPPFYVCCESLCLLSVRVKRPKHKKTRKREGDGLRYHINMQTITQYAEPISFSTMILSPFFSYISPSLSLSAFFCFSLYFLF